MVFLQVSEEGQNRSDRSCSNLKKTSQFPLNFSVDIWGENAIGLEASSHVVVAQTVPEKKILVNNYRHFAYKHISHSLEIN